MNGTSPCPVVISAALWLFCSLARAQPAQQVGPSSTAAPTGPVSAPVQGPPGNAYPALPAAPMPQGPVPYVAPPTYLLELDLLQRESYVRARLQAVRNQSRTLTLEGRPPFYTTRLALGFSAIAVGGAALVLSSGAFLIDTLPHGSESDRRNETMLLSFAGSGAVVAILGLCTVLSTRWGNTNRDQVKDLEREQSELVRALRELERERKLRLKYGMAPAYSPSGGAGLALTVQMVL